MGKVIGVVCYDLLGEIVKNAYGDILVFPDTKIAKEVTGFFTTVKLIKAQVPRKKKQPE